MNRIIDKQSCRRYSKTFMNDNTNYNPQSHVKFLKLQGCKNITTNHYDEKEFYKIIKMIKRCTKLVYFDLYLLPMVNKVAHNNVRRTSPGTN